MSKAIAFTILFLNCLLLSGCPSGGATSGSNPSPDPPIGHKLTRAAPLTELEVSQILRADGQDVGGVARAVFAIARARSGNGEEFEMQSFFARIDQSISIDCHVSCSLNHK